MATVISIAIETLRRAGADGMTFAELADAMSFAGSRSSLQSQINAKVRSGVLVKRTESDGVVYSVAADAPARPKASRSKTASAGERSQAGAVLPAATAQASVAAKAAPAPAPGTSIDRLVRELITAPLGLLDRLGVIAADIDDALGDAIDASVDKVTLKALAGASACTRRAQVELLTRTRT